MAVVRCAVLQQPATGVRLHDALNETRRRRSGPARCCTPAPLWDALLAHDWHRLFIELRPLWNQAQLTVFGHALLEQLATPRKDLTAHVLAMPAPATRGTELDRWLADQLTAPVLARKPFTPLPVLGVPDWTPRNRHLSFYDDSQVFRAAAPARTTGPPATDPRS